MSALGQKQTCAVQNAMSALPPIADMRSAKTKARFVPIADIGRRFCVYIFVHTAPPRSVGESLPCAKQRTVSQYQLQLM